jgi:hypothetical protein
VSRIDSRSALRRVSWLIAALVAVLASSFALLPTASASTSTPPGVTLTASPGGTITGFTRVTFTVAVTPAEGGLVQLLANGAPVGATMVVNGQAVLTTTQLPLGALSVVADFTPSNDATAETRSAPVALTVVPTPLVYLISTTGAMLPPGGQIAADQIVEVHLSSFESMGHVTLAIGSNVLAASVPLDANGSGVAGVVVPKTLVSNVYLLEALGGARSGSFPFYVYNPTDRNDDHPTPTPTPKQPKPTKPPLPDGQNISVVLRHQRLPGTGGGHHGGSGDPGLAHTGSDALNLVVIAGIALLVGGVLVRLSAIPPRQRGRHLHGTARTSAV